MTETRLKRRCLKCGNNTIFEVHGAYSEPEEIATDIYHITEWSLMECMTCSQPMLEQTIKVIQVKRDYEESPGEWEEIVVEPKTSIPYPITDLAGIPLPSPKMPAAIADDYNEARAIFGISPRSSAALLRLALQKLCIHLGAPGKNLNDDIGALAEKGFSIQTIQAMDITRVIGNNAVHPGEIDVHADKEAVFNVFGIFNLLINQTIIQPQEIARLSNGLPEDKKKAIEQRTQKKHKRRQDNQ
ncbi:MAG TPA: DUF4145 domain-containing protein [Ktedonosporobacter sp.]|nr:DUF4145 domain-containing protein [Ktedonosporobacter sp.]